MPITFTVSDIHLLCIKFAHAPWLCCVSWWTSVQDVDSVNPFFPPHTKKCRLKGWISRCPNTVSFTQGNKGVEWIFPLSNFWGGLTVIRVFFWLCVCMFSVDTWKLHWPDMGFKEDEWKECCSSIKAERSKIKQPRKCDMDASPKSKLYREKQKRDGCVWGKKAPRQSANWKSYKCCWWRTNRGHVIAIFSTLIICLRIRDKKARRAS